jgi:hypothetical protein
LDVIIPPAELLQRVPALRRSTPIASRGSASGLYLFVLSHDIIQKVCNFSEVYALERSLKDLCFLAFS